MANKVVTVNGLKLSIDQRVFNDLRFIEMLDDCQNNGNTSRIIPTMKLFFGDEQYQKVSDHCSDEDGFVAVDKFTEVFTKAMEKAAPNS